MTEYKLCGFEDERTGQVDTWIMRDGQSMSSEEIVQTLTEQEAGIERLRAEQDTAQRVFRALRAAWFASHLRSNAHEREWEDEEHEQLRHEWNAKLLARYASQTEGILNGEDWPVFPTCAADMDMTNASAAGGE